MATEYDERSDELVGLASRVGGRVDEVRLDMRDMRKEMSEMSSELNEHSSRFDKLETALQVTSGLQNDVIPKVIEIQKTVNRISETQSEQTFKIIDMLNRANIGEIERRVTNIEQKLTK